MAEQSLRNKTVIGVGWSAADAFLGQGVTFLIGIILARLLTPAEYGLIGIVTIFTSILTGIVDSGFSNAIIRKNDIKEDDYNTMFITNMLLSVVLFVFLYFLAPFIAVFFARPELTSLTRVMGLILIIQALSLVQVTKLTKAIDFKTKTKASLFSAIISGIIGVLMALMNFGVWALVGQLLSKQFFYTVSLWVLNKWIPKLVFCRQSFLYLWGFGWKLMLSGLLNNIWNQLYQVVVGRFYSPGTLGQYSRAKEYAQIFSSNFTTIFQRVTYPVLAEIQEDQERLVAAYRKVIKSTMFVTSVCMITMGAVSEPLVFCLIGPQWHEAATYLPFICFSLSLYPLHAINLNILQVQGRSDLYLILEIIKKILAIGPICLGIFVSIYWMLVGTIIVGFISFFLNSYYSGKKLGYTSCQQLKDIAPSYGVAFAIAFAVYFVKYLPLSNYFILLLQFLIGVIVFWGICRVTGMEEYIEVRRIAITYYNRIKSRR